MCAAGCNILPVRYISIKIRAATLPKLRLLSALSGKRITMLIDEWVTAELARRGEIDSHIDSHQEGMTGSEDADIAHHKEE